MLKRLDEKDLETRRPFEGGFTLIELLVVVIILGILAAVVVFSVGGVGDQGQESACKVDTRVLGTAEAAYFSQVREDEGSGAFTDEPSLETLQLLSDQSSLHNIEGVTPLAAVTGVAEPRFEKYEIRMTADGAKKCIPKGAVGTECPGPATTLPVKDTPVKVCTKPNASDPDKDVKYPF